MASIIQQYPSNGKDEAIIRKSGDFAPSYWGDFFISLPLKDDSSIEERVEELKTEVKKMVQHANEPLQKLSLIDAIQRLGLSYHFQEEINLSLKQINNEYCITDGLHAFALRFRLLRQHGYNTPTDGFKKFMNENGKFKESFSSDARGLLSLYEVGHFGLPGEDVLDEAIAFAGYHLKLIISKVSDSLAMDIERALDVPLRRGMARLEARQYIDVYERDEKPCHELLELAKLDFNRVQCLLQKELKDISIWWKDLGLIKKLSFARDRLVECYFWALGVCHNPHQSRSRRVFTKVIVFLSTMDDIYDVYGTLEELIPFNDVIQRRDMEAMKQLPEYMQIFIHALEGTYKEIEDELLVEGNSYRMGYLKEVVKRLSGAYLQEAIWGSHKYVPSLKEHLQDGQVISTIKCYMSEARVSEEEALLEFQKMISNAWKNINEELLKASTFPVSVVLAPAHSLACMGHVIYNKYDTYKDPAGEMKDKITMLMVDPVPI
ncbi:(-)-germacrene D synthase [Acorus calamus]|uniref:(-)-germacrene D synthase n=1 Tax=Acorus calamus TaxID=4465 RepID=A0AAV9C0B1_ACOCL|nr:(-)-germacrene D synthase [Acorus calamus]